MPRSLARYDVAAVGPSGAYEDIFMSKKYNSGDAGEEIYGFMIRAESVDSTGATVSGQLEVVIDNFMENSSGVDTTVTLYPGETWYLSRHNPFARGFRYIKVRAPHATNKACVSFRPTVV